MLRPVTTTLSTFLNLSRHELGDLQFKFTYVGEQRKLLPTIMIVGPNVLEDEPSVLAVQAPGLDFGNDRIARAVLSASPEELRNALEALARFPNIAMGSGEAEFGSATRDALLVMAIYHPLDGASQSLVVPLDPTDAELVLDGLGKALSENKDCVRHLFILWRALGFHIGSLDPDSDGDGASDGRERSRGTDPCEPSSAGDGGLDGERILAGVDPLNVLAPLSSPENVSINQGPFRGTRVVEVATAPEKTWGTATLEISYSPEEFVQDCERVVFMQTFKRSAVKENGVRLPIAPSLYLVYAGSPELDQFTVEGETIDHKVGELDPYYNGDDPHDMFSGVPDLQTPGACNGSARRVARMFYRARTYEHHWRLLNPEGVAEVIFEYETAAFCDAGEGRGRFLGTVEWQWGKKRSQPLTAWIGEASGVTGPPDTLVTVTGPNAHESVPVYSRFAAGQPSDDYLRVLSLWGRYHKFPIPGPRVVMGDDVVITVPQPVSHPIEIVMSVPEVPYAPAMSTGLVVSGFLRELRGTRQDGTALPSSCFPFALPVRVEFTYSDDDVAGLDRAQLGIGWFDERRGQFVPDGVNILKKDGAEQSIEFTTDRFGVFAIVGAASPDRSR